ncbi:hypothetical protein HCN44_007525 [Aphidius gifuensis]|uniref:CUB domain-containing protein n=2 Tax=Aphidius gifuensis TaxID=684658 RepID=A0A834XJB3_APHGI|nr:hypothetical protein HCN44_007525 [Aphidius gifuensis]
MVAWLPSHVLLFLILVTGIQPKKYNQNNKSKNESITLKYLYYQSGMNTLTDYHTFERVMKTNNRSSQINAINNYYTTSNINNSEVENNIKLNEKINKNKSNNYSIPSRAKYNVKISQNTQMIKPKNNTLIDENKNYLKKNKLLRSNKSVILKNSDTVKQVDSLKLINGINDNLVIKKLDFNSKKNNSTYHNKNVPIVIDNSLKFNTSELFNNQPIKNVVFLPKITKLNINKVNVSTLNKIKEKNYIYKNSNGLNKHDKIKINNNFLSTIDSDDKMYNNYTVFNFLNTDIDFWKRNKRETPKNACEKFENDDPSKNEFYSPNYPQNYQASVDCVRVLEADEGMLLKLDFRDIFELEAANNDKETECRFDYLEVRDGKYGFSTLIKKYCGTNFPPEIISKSRYLWLHFHSDDTIEYQGFKAIWTMVPRPTNQGVSTDQDHCYIAVECDSQTLISSEDAQEEKKKAEKNSIAFDCLWAITAKDGWRMQLTFDSFKLDKPNDCDANFLDVFGERTDMPSRIKNFCGSIAEPVVTKTNTMYIRFYLEPKALNSSFESFITAVRDKESNDKPCRPDEYDCDDATCIASHLQCNGKHNCRLRWDEDVSICGNTKGSIALDSTRIVIILVIFSMIMFGMIFALGFNCIRKLIRDHRIIREHIRQSQENRLDEIGRSGLSQTDICQQRCESPTQECSHKDIIPEMTLVPQDYKKELVLEMNYENEETNDIHQCNNFKNATQERLQETNDEPDMCDNSCQTRESLFYPCNNNTDDILQYDNDNIDLSINNSNSYKNENYYHCNSISSTKKNQEKCPRCRLTLIKPSVSNTNSHIPAPAGWSIHNSSDLSDNCDNYYQNDNDKNYHRHHTHDLKIDTHNKYDNICKKQIIGSGERYESFIFDCDKKKSDTTVSSNSHNSDIRKYPITQNSHHRAEAVIDIDSNRPFSIESTKSAPDVIATH